MSFCSQIAAATLNYGEIYASATAISQTTNATIGVFNKLTCFATNGGAKGVVVDNANDLLKPLSGGVFQVSVTVSFTNGNNHDFNFRIFNQTTGIAYANTTVSLHTVGLDVQNLSLISVISANANDNLIVQVSGSVANQIFIVTDATFSILQIG